MKNIHFPLVIFVLSVIQLNLVAQQQGFGCIKNKKFLSISGIEKNDKATNDPIIDMLPIFGKKARKSGNNPPLPFGIGIYSIYYDQGYTASNLKLIPDTPPITARADTVYQNTTAYEFKAQIRPNLWLFPFLNVYGIFGYTEGVISPNLVVPCIVVENVPIFDSMVIDSTFEIHDDIAYVGSTYGIGATFSMGTGSFFVMADYNYSVTDPADLDENLHNHFFSPKIGVLLGNNKRKSFGAMWLGAMYISNDQSFSGKMDVADITPELVFLLGEEATYSGKLSANQRWNFVFGGSWIINGHHHFILEAGFMGRKQISFGYDFRF